MPRCEYHCEACNRKVTLRLSVTQHEKARQACPKCGSKKLTQLISSFLEGVTSPQAGIACGAVDEDGGVRRAGSSVQAEGRRWERRGRR